MRLEGKVAVITGGGSGIGRETAVAFAREGARVAIWDYDKDMGQKTAEEIQEKGGEALFFQVDVSQEAEVAQAAQSTLEAFSVVDILINNAGITRDGFLTKMATEDWQKVLDVNLTGVFLCTKALIPQMMERESGVVINTSSVVGVYGNIGQTNYSATKAGVVGMTKSWAKEFGKKGIRVNAIAPGFIQTAMTEAVPEKVLDKMEKKTPLGRLGSPEDIAWAYVYLASEEASFVSGAVLQVDGGLTL